MFLEPDLDTVVDDSCRMKSGSEFSDLVCEYLWHEWGVEVFVLPSETRKDLKRHLKRMSHLGVSGASSKIMEWLWMEGVRRWNEENLRGFD